MRVFLLGGTGFVGGHILEALLSAGHEVTCLVRDPRALSEHGDRVRRVTGDIALPHTYRASLQDHRATINCVGLIRERRRKGVTYERVVVRGTQAWVDAAKEAGVKHVLLISALGAGPEGTPYQVTKWKAEQAVRLSGLAWTIFRPSIIFGPGEDATREFARMLRRRIVPLPGGGKPVFEPVAVWDVARCVAGALERAEARNRVFHLGGPEQITLKQIYGQIQRVLGVRVLYLPVPFWVSKLGAALLSWLPFFPATLEMVRLLQQGSVAPEHDWAKVFGLGPVRLGDGLPLYMGAQTSVGGR